MVGGREGGSEGNVNGETMFFLYKKISRAPGTSNPKSQVSNFYELYPEGLHVKENGDLWGPMQTSSFGWRMEIQRQCITNQIGVILFCMSYVLFLVRS